MQQLTDIRNQIHTALNQQTTAEAELKESQAAYDEKLAEFEASNKELVSRRNKAIINYDNAKKSLTSARASAKVLLAEEFLDELPEGFKQNKTKQVVYDPQGFRKQALEHFHFLLVLDDKAVHKFFTSMVEEKKDGALVLPEYIRSLASVEVLSSPGQVISNATIEKLELEPDITIFEDVLEEVTQENSPVDEPEKVTLTDQDKNLVPLGEINF